MEPQSIGRYRVVRELGHGAMGVVYEAEDPNIGRTVALKVVRTDQMGANREEVLRRFKNEARAAGNLNHPNIITIHDAGEHEGMLFIAMECVKGSSLADVMAKQGRMAPGKVVEIIRQVCLGLDFAHGRGIIHRDIKPANILLAESLVKISDFGIANVGDGMTMTGTVVGTPNYMSPEQVLSKPLDGRSDLFSVGVMLYEMVTGERPFEGQSITSIMYKIVHQEPVAPRQLDGTIHPGLSAVVEKALAKSPEARFQSGAELAAALEQYQKLGSGPITASNMPTVDIPALPETASYAGIPAGVAGPATGPAGMPTIAQPPTTQQVPPPAEKKPRGVLPTVLMGCFGVIALGTIAITVIVLVAMHGREGKASKGKVSTSQAETAAPAKVNEVSPAKASETQATLKVDSSPPAAEVLVDGKRTGKTTPATITVARGQHEIEVRMPGFQTASAKFKVSGGEELEYSPELSVVMPVINIPNVTVPKVPGVMDQSQGEEPEKRPGLSEAQQQMIGALAQWNEMQRVGEPAILVKSDLPGGRIFMDGNDTGKKTPAVIAAGEGSHTVRVELAGHKAYEKTVKIKKGIPAVVSARFGETQ